MRETSAVSAFGNEQMKIGISKGVCSERAPKAVSCSKYKIEKQKVRRSLSAEISRCTRISVRDFGSRAKDNPTFQINKRALTNSHAAWNSIPARSSETRLFMSLTSARRGACARERSETLSSAESNEFLYLQDGKNGVGSNEVLLCAFSLAHCYFKLSVCTFVPFL